MQKFYESLKKEQIAPVYLFYGEEAVLMDEALAALTKVVLPAADDWSREVFDGEQATPDELVSAAQAGNFFGGRRLIVAKGVTWLDAPKGKSGEVDPAGFLAYLNDPNPDTVLVLTVRGSLDKRRKPVQAVQKKGRLVEFSTPKGGEKDIWLAKRFQSRGKQADKQVVSYISLSAANLSQLASEVEKLCLYVGERAQVTLADAEAVVSKSSIFSIFELTDAAAAKNAARAVTAYQNLLTQGEEEQKIFVMLANQFRNMLLVQDMLAQGYRAGDLASLLGLHPYVVEKCSKQARAFKQTQLIKALEMLLAADLAQKSGGGEMRELLETVILRICAF